MRTWLRMGWGYKTALFSRSGFLFFTLQVYLCLTKRPKKPNVCTLFSQLWVLKRCQKPAICVAWIFCSLQNYNFLITCLWGTEVQIIKNLRSLLCVKYLAHALFFLFDGTKRMTSNDMGGFCVLWTKNRTILLACSWDLCFASNRMVPGNMSARRKEKKVKKFSKSHPRLLCLRAWRSDISFARGFIRNGV